MARMAKPPTAPPTIAPTGSGAGGGTTGMIVMTGEIEGAVLEAVLGAEKELLLNDREVLVEDLEVELEMREGDWV